MHENTKRALLLVENFIDEYGDHLRPPINIEVTDDSAEVHVNLTSVDDMNRVHAGFDSPKWVVSNTDTSASAEVGQVRVTIYYSGLRDEPEAQAPLRHLGLVKGLAVVQ